MNGDLPEDAADPETTPQSDPDLSAVDEFDTDFWCHEIPELPRVSLKQKSLCWNPGQMVRIQREAFPVGCAMMCAIPGAIVLTFVMLILREQLFGGLGSAWSYGAAVATGLIVGGWFVYRKLRGPFHEITLDWEEQTLRCRKSRSTREFGLHEIQQIAVVPVARPNYFRAQVEVRLDRGTEILLETDPPEDEALIPCRQLAPAALRLAEALSVPLIVEIDATAIDNAEILQGGPTAVEIAANYAKLGERREMDMFSAQMKGQAEEAAEKKQQATGYYMEAARLNPSETTPLLKLANLSDKEAHIDQAIDLAIEANPEDPEPLMARGFQLCLDGKYEESLADYTAAIRLEPSVKSYHGRADVHLAREDYAAAVDDSTKALELDSDDPWCYHQRGACLRDWYRETNQEETLNRALSDLDRADQLDSDNDMHRIERCELLKDAGRLEEAIAGFSELIAADGSNFYLYSQRGQAHFDARQFRPAVRDFTESIDALEKQPRPADSSMARTHQDSIGYAYRWRSEAYRQMGENIKADEDAAQSAALLGS